MNSTRGFSCRSGRRVEKSLLIITHVVALCEFQRRVGPAESARHSTPLRTVPPHVTTVTP